MRENINKVDLGDSLVFKIYENLDFPYDNPLEINGLNLNFTVLSDNSEFEGCFIESGYNPLSSSKGDRKGTSYKAQLDAEPSLDWSVSHIEDSKKIYSSFDR